MGTPKSNTTKLVSLREFKLQKQAWWPPMLFTITKSTQSQLELLLNTVLPVLWPDISPQAKLKVELLSTTLSMVFLLFLVIMFHSLWWQVPQHTITLPLEAWQELFPLQSTTVASTWELMLFQAHQHLDQDQPTQLIPATQLLQSQMLFHNTTTSDASQDTLWKTTIFLWWSE